MKKNNVLFAFLFTIFLIMGSITNVNADDFTQPLCEYEIDCNKAASLYTDKKLGNTEKYLLQLYKKSNGQYVWMGNNDNYYKGDCPECSDATRELYYNHMNQFCGISYNPTISQYRGLNVKYLKDYAESIYNNGSCKDLYIVRQEYDSSAKIDEDLFNSLYIFGPSDNLEDGNEKYQYAGSSINGFVPKFNWYSGSITVKGKTVLQENDFACYYKCQSKSSGYDNLKIEYISGIYDFSLKWETSQGTIQNVFTPMYNESNTCPKNFYTCITPTSNEYTFVENKNECKSVPLSCEVLTQDSYLDGNGETSGSGNTTDKVITLDGRVITPAVQNIIFWILTAVKYVAIIILIVLGILDFLKATASGSEDETKKSRQKFMKRLVACIVLFLIPYLVNILLSLVNLTMGTDYVTSEETTETTK